MVPAQEMGGIIIVAVVAVVLQLELTLLALGSMASLSWDMSPPARPVNGGPVPGPRPTGRRAQAGVRGGPGWGGSGKPERETGFCFMDDRGLCTVQERPCRESTWVLEKARGRGDSEETGPCLEAVLP